jgi:hypothetical protein
MSWFKENPILSVALLVCLLIAGAIAYYASEAASTYQAAHDSLTSQINVFSSLQKKSPYPTEENLKILTESRDKYAVALSDLKSTISKMEAPLEAITPQEFQDKLREGVNELSKSAKEKNIKLPEKFFFGFDEYQAQLPSPEAAPALNRDFKILQKLLQTLVDLPVEAINSLERAAPPEVAPTPTPTPPPTPKKSSSSTPSSPPPILSTRFKLSFIASQEKTRAAINLIPKSEAFLIIRSLVMENTTPAAPSKKDAIPPTGGNKKSDRLQVLLGNESVKTDLSLEILDFPNPEPEPPIKQ